MGLVADYNIYRNDPGMGVVIHIGGSVIYGGGSLELKYVSGGTNANLIRKNTPKRFTSGRARFLWSRSSGSLGDDPGFAFNLSQEDITGAAGTGYLFTLNRPGASIEPRLYRMSAGMPTKTLLVQGSNLALPTPPQSYPVEVSWRVDIENLGGVNVVCKTGALADYRGVSLAWDTLLTTTRFDYLHTSSYFTNSQGEGPGVALAGTSGVYYFDEMTVVPLLVGGLTT